jgi:hypothetical protein
MKIQSTKKRAEKIFHTYIRMRDCLETTGTLTRGRCFTCNKVYPVDALEAGHFYHNGNDFDERNLHAQCTHCNHFLSGNGVEYYPKMLSKYGQEVIDELKAKKRQIQKPTLEWLIKFILDIKEKITYMEEL